MKKSQLEDIFNSSAIRLLEYKILRIESKCRVLEAQGYTRPDKEEIVRHLLDIRKVLLDKSFIMDDENRELLIDCNKAFTDLQCKVQTDVRRVLDATIRSSTMGDVLVNCCSTLSRRYPMNHPVQTVRAKKIWQVLTGPYGETGYYAAGLNIPGDSMTYFRNSSSSANDGGVLSFSEYDNHKKDIHGVKVCSTLYDLYDYSPFSLYDILWVRSFDTEMYVNEDYSNYEPSNGIELPNWMDI